MMMTTIDDDDDDDTVIEISSGRCVDGSGKAADESLSQAVEPRYSRSRQRRSPTCRGRSVCMVVLVYHHVLLLPCQIFTHWRRKLWGTGARAPPPLPLELARVHQLGNYYLRITAVGSDRLLVNTFFCSSHKLTVAKVDLTLVYYIIFTYKHQ